jgi:predicted O-methyltransferase YrrM
MALYAPQFHTVEQGHKLTNVDSWICTSLLPPNESLESTLKANAASGLYAADVAPNQGKLLYLLAKMNHCKRILEVGTLEGYSAICLAQALPSSPSSKLITLEIEERFAQVARRNIANAGFESVVEVKVGPALQTLEEVGKQGTEAFDLVFIDADKENSPNYVKWALEFSYVGTVIIVDNVVRRGNPSDVGNGDDDPAILGMRDLFEMMKAEPRLDCTAIQTVGSKGWDGFAIGLVIA